MKVTFYFIVLTFVCSSCQSHSNEKDSQQKKTDTGAISNPHRSVAKKNNIYADNFDVFWKSFRQAVLTSDTVEIIALTQFPFETRGALDSDPTIGYNKQEFPHVFKAFLNQWNGMDLEGTTELESINKTTTIIEKDIADDYTRVGNLVFRKTQDGWKLVFAYLNNETIDTLSK